MDLKNLKKLTDYLYEIPQSFRSDMLVPARVYADMEMLKEIGEDRSLDQLVNITTLRGIQKYAIAMPDIHEGYGFPIGGVVAVDFETGVISPGGIGYDINCGVRLLVSPLLHNEIEPHLVNLANQIMRDVPSGVGRGGDIELSAEQMDKVLEGGAEALVGAGYGKKEDLEKLESNGRIKEADATCVSSHAKNRGRDQLGTLGSGNHFLEIQKIEEIYDEETAKIFGLKKNGITVLIHTGSRGLGHQVCTDYVRLMLGKLREWKIDLPDRELACAPLGSKEGQDYLKAMSAAANFAWANRQVITQTVRKAWERILEKTGLNSNLEIVYDVAHNVGKVEKHKIGKGEKTVLVHRKGATRCFAPNHPDLPQVYQKTGQPVLIPGSMGTFSYVLAGLETAMEETFGTVCHGAGRRMSRGEAKRTVTGSELRKQLEEQGIIIRCASNAGLAEEAPLAYKDVNKVVNIVATAGIAKKVAKLKPLAVVKGG
jgi:tRNA-splicing ligase RtcB